MYIDHSVFSTPTQATTQAFNPLSMIKGALGSINPYNVAWDVINYKNKTSQQDYMKALQEKIFQREDTAYQRTAEDMRKAGLNPLSMQGTNNAGSAVSLPDLTSGTPAESMSTSIQRFVDNANNTALAMDTLKNSENDRKLNTMRTINEVAQMRANINNMKIDSKSKKQLLEHLQREYKHMEENGLYDYDSGVTKELKSVLTYLSTQKPDIKKVLETQFPWIKYVSEGISNGYLSKEQLENLKKESPLMYMLIAPIFSQSVLQSTFSNGKKSDPVLGNSLFQDIFGIELK